MLKAVLDERGKAYLVESEIVQMGKKKCNSRNVRKVHDGNGEIRKSLKNEMQTRQKVECARVEMETVGNRETGKCGKIDTLKCESV